jgi:teichuronic acid biosynthesis glycosyltransferase TuaC
MDYIRESSAHMNTLFVCSGNKGSVSPFIMDQKEALESKGVSVDIFTVRGKGISGYLKSLKALKARLRRESYDFIHAHYGLSGLLAGLQLKVPVILTLHGSDVNQPFIRFFSRIASFLARKVIVVSEKMRALLKSRNTEVKVIPCGVDMELFRPMNKQEARKRLESTGKLKFEKGKSYVLFSSSFDMEVKNPALAMEAAQSLGDGYELIELKGYSREEVALLLNTVDVALLTSKTEGSPQFIKEAMACDCPIVTTDVGDVRQIINNTKGCFICEPAVADVSEKVKKATHFRQTKGREKIPADYSKEAVSEHIIDEYVNLVEKT